ncbi:MAG TPA: ATP-binding protein [Thermoanaerobaculia bacterium]|nr:ATP-binding protein [Thermoanaerobaculia bacterium]
MKTSTEEGYTSQDLDEQRKFVKELNKRGFSYPLIAAEAFVRGMRDSGYKSTATALDEFIDNAIQAQADQVDLVIGYAAGNTSKKKPDYLAVVDNGHGMDPDMIRLAVLWGGTHRENDRRSFGRYGFGLPSAAVSISRSFAVISKVPGGQWQSVRIDLDEIASGKLNNKQGVVEAPAAVPGQVPPFVRGSLHGTDLAHGTVVLLDNLDRLMWKTSAALKENLLHHFGLIYRELLRSVKIRVIDGADETVVQPIDPLFLRPDGRYYDDGPLHAEALPPASFTVKDRESREKEAGTVRVRYSYMPPEFQRRSDGSWSSRLKVMKDNNGFIVLRAGRQIDLVTKIPDVTLVNFDRNWGIEIDFDPTLDEEFGVTTNKQQITISERMWDLLKQNGVLSAMKELKARFEADRRKNEEKKKAKQQPGEKDSEKVAAETQKLRTRKAVPPTPEKEEKSHKLLEEEAKRLSRETGKPEETVKKEIESRPFKVDFEELPGAPFYRMLQVGGQKQLRINLSHRFYSDVYAGPHASRRLQSALELLLMVFGECELDADREREAFYRTERPEWSRRLEIVLEGLDQRDPILDFQSAAEAFAEQALSQ